jgi:large subunit ribosomal protein L24
MKILTKDLVKIIAGKDKGKTGEVRRVLPEKNKVVVDGLNLVTKHLKKKEGQAGQKVKVPAPIHISNVQIVCPKTKKPTRVSYIVSKNGKKERVAKVSGEILKNSALKK